MKFFLSLSFLLLFWSISILAQVSDRRTAKVISVIDGDTVRVSLNGKIEKVRLIGVNAPELGDSRARVRCFAYAAKWFAQEKVQGLTVTLESDPTQVDRDRYGRLLRYIFWNNGNFNLYIIKQGFANEFTYDRPYRYQKEFKAAQRYAKESKWGLWDSAECRYANK